MSDTLNVKKREETGTLRMRRMRKSGSIPAILYGRGADPVALTLATSEVDTLIRHGSHIVELVGDVKESALIKHVQWDQMGSDVLHLDLTRIDVSEELEVTIQVELRGVAPGSKQGGTVQQMNHEVEIACRADKIPDTLDVSINSLELDQTILAGDLELPEGVKLISPADDVIVTCVEVTQQEEDPADFSAAEPEVIGRSADEDDGEENKD